MKKSIFVLIVFLSTFPLYLHAERQDVSKFDGNDWNEWQVFRKYNFISGFIAGTAYVVEYNMQTQEENYDSDKASEIFVSYVWPDEKKPKNLFSRKEISLLLGNTKEAFNSSLFRYMILGITNDQIVDGLNLLYTDFKNRQIKLTDAIYVVKKQIRGASPEEIEAILLYLRAEKDYKKLFYTNKEGKRNYASFP